jgi:NAD(P)-dependent dehydrogenase (short-subunit alcohol dehydrogenase family)
VARRVFVTGASRGIGEAVARRFRDDGHEVIAPPRGELDLGAFESVKGYLSRNSGLAVDVLVNNAGINEVHPIATLPLEIWIRTLETNLTSAFLLTQAFAPGMARSGWGRIVNVSSCYALVGCPGRAAYSSSKAGLLALTRATALEFGARGVLVNAVCPGFVATELTFKNNTAEQIERLRLQVPLQRLAKAEEIAEVVLFLGSHKNAYIHGQSIVADGGFIIQ